MKVMSVVPVEIQLAEGVALPEYKTSGSSGMDICANESIIVPSFSSVAVSTGIKVAIPDFYELQIRPRSGLAIKSNITVLNTPGTIDSDYRGEIKVILYNAGPHDYLVNKGDRIAQAVLQYVPKVEWFKSEELDETDRGEGGFGSTGI